MQLTIFNDIETAILNIIAHLNDAAFQTLLISTIETFPSAYIGNQTTPNRSTKSDKIRKREGETFGLLFGQRMLKHEDLIYNVTLAVPMQTARREKEMVTFNQRYLDRIREVTESFPYLEFLGAFHSHPCHKDDYDADSISMFSPEDAASAVGLAEEYGNDLLEVILGITALDRHSKRPALVDGETIQSYCGRFKYSLSAYCTLGAISDEDDDLELDDEAVEELLQVIEEDELECYEVDEEYEDPEVEDEELESCMVPVDRLICPLAAHGGGIFGKTEILG